MTRKDKWGVFAALLILGWVFNFQFFDWISPAKIFAMNDVPTIMEGYRSAPNFWAATLKYWTGGFIQDEIRSFRPLSAMLYYFNCWLGLSFGFLWTALVTFVLFISNGAVACVLAWRLTRSRICVYFAAILTSQIIWHNGQPFYWLAYWPVQDNLLLISFFLGAVVLFDVWFENGERKYLLGAWAAFILACCSKEYAFIFPLFALAIVTLRAPLKVSRRDGLIQVAGFFAFVLALWFVRAALIPDARNPTLRRVHFIKKPFLYGYYPFYRSGLTGQYWFMGLPFLLFTFGGLAFKFRRAAILQKPFMPLIAALGALGIVALYLTIFHSVGEAFWYLFEPSAALTRTTELFYMIATIYSVWLLLKYRKTQPTLLAWAFLIGSYLPVIAYLGWHYTIPGWFVRCAYWALVLKLFWLDIRRPFDSAMSYASFETEHKYAIGAFRRR